MKLLILFELIGLLAFGSLAAPSLKYVAQGNPLPKKEEPNETITIIEIAAIDFEGFTVKLYYNPLSGFSYSDPNSMWDRQKIPVCNANQSKCLYADFYHQYELKQNGELLVPDQIIEFNEEGVNTEIYIYFLDTSSEILQKYTYYEQNIMRHCYQPNFCRTMKTVTPQEIYDLAKNWKEMTDIDKKRYIRNLDALLFIEDSWHVFNPETGGTSYTDADIKLSWYQSDQGTNYVSLNNSIGGYDYYELTETEFEELKAVIGK